jgi:hypothetical protein
MRRICTVLAAMALGFGLTGASPAVAGVATATDVSTVASSPGTPARINVWWTAHWTATEAECRKDGRGYVRRGAKAYACEYDSAAPNPAHPWRLRVLD